MKRKSLWLAALVIVSLGTASLVALADPPYQDLEQKPPDPEPQPCYCPHIYEPVVCRASDGSLHEYSNACFAGCDGFTRCSRYEPRP